jgi:hypothetical protein
VSVDPEMVVLIAANCESPVYSPEAGTQWAFNRLHELLEHHPDDAWGLALAVLPRLRSDDAVAFLGMIIVDELLGRHFLRIAPVIEVAMHADPQVAAAVAAASPVSGGEAHRAAASLIRRAQVLAGQRVYPWLRAEAGR